MSTGSIFGRVGTAACPEEIAGTLGTCLEQPDVRETLDERYVPEDFQDGGALQHVLADTQEVYEPILGEA